MQSNISNIQINSRGFWINKFCVASGNLVARKFEIKLFTIKFNRWQCHAVGLEKGATENARPDIARPSKLWGLTLRDWTTRHQIKQVATSWTSVSPRKNRTCWTISERIKSCLSRFDSGIYSRLQFLRSVSHSVGAHTESLQPPVDNRSNSNSSEDEDENKHGASCVSSANFRGDGIGNGSRGNNLGRLLRSVHRGATCWLRTGAVRT